MKNAVIYARFSSHAQNEQSIEGQLKECYAFAERSGALVSRHAHAAQSRLLVFG